MVRFENELLFYLLMQPVQINDIRQLVAKKGEPLDFEMKVPRGANNIDYASSGS